MTPTLTNPQKYSPEFGFTPGVVVDFIYAPLRCSVVGYFILFDGQHLTISNVAGRDKYYSPGIEQIRILSGKWSSWQFAPAGAVGCLVYPDSKVPVYFAHENWSPLVDSMPDDVVKMPAPWWWLEGQK